MIRILTHSEIDRIKWAEFVQAHPKGNVFQTPEMYDVYVQTKQIQPLILAAEENGTIVGIMLTQIITNGNALISWLTARAIIIGGPLVKDNREDVLYALLKAYKASLPCKIIYSEIRPVYIMDDLWCSLRSDKWQRKGHYNITLSLNKSSDDLFLQMHKERRRNVNQAVKAGLVFSEVVDRNEVLAIVKLIKQTYERKHVPISYLDMFDEVYQLMRQYARFFACYTSDGQMIAGQVRLCYKDLVYSWFAGSDEKYFKLRPNDFTMWNVIKWSAENGYSLFDFGGGGEPGVEYGVRDYKLKYGCEMFDYGRYIYAHRPFIYALAKLAYCTYHKIKGK